MLPAWKDSALWMGRNKSDPRLYQGAQRQIPAVHNLVAWTRLRLASSSQCHFQNPMCEGGWGRGGQGRKWQHRSTSFCLLSIYRPWRNFLELSSCFFFFFLHIRFATVTFKLARKQCLLRNRPVKAPIPLELRHYVPVIACDLPISREASH